MTKLRICRHHGPMGWVNYTPTINLAGNRASQRHESKICSAVPDLCQSSNMDCNFLWVKCLSWRFTYPKIIPSSSAVNADASVQSLYFQHWRNDYQNNTKQSHLPLHLDAFWTYGCREFISPELLLFLNCSLTTCHHQLSNLQKFINFMNSWKPIN